MASAIIYRTRTRDDQPITVRPRREFFDVFVGGWRVAILKTMAGAIRRADREATRGA